MSMAYINVCVRGQVRLYDEATKTLQSTLTGGYVLTARRRLSRAAQSLQRR